MGRIECSPKGNQEAREPLKTKILFFLGYSMFGPFSVGSTNFILMPEVILFSLTALMGSSPSSYPNVFKRGQRG